MSKDAKGMKAERGLLPRLRFPEFRGEWVSSPVSKVYSFKGNNSLSRDKLNYEGGLFRNIHYGDIHTKFAPRFCVDSESVPYVNDEESHSAIRPENYCSAGDMVFADASEDTADIGKAIEIINTGDVPLVSGLHTILARPNVYTFALGFGAYLFSSEGVRKKIQREAQGAKMLGLSASRLGNVLLRYPAETDEQQKIADCLSSLDELITAETQKLDALKTHKKGLMQQLFPAEGETLPKLRFPEFREAGEWKEKKLGEFSHVVASGDLNTTCFSPIKTDEYNYPVYSNAIEEQGLYGYYTAPRFSKDSVTITARGNLGVAFFRSHEFMGIGRLLVASNFQDANPRFITECWNHLGKVPTEVTSIPQFTAVAAKATVLPIPSITEQQKIADCLSSLDELITAQTQKLVILKTHKKALMQQLFPSPEAETP
ncbi:MAG: restriction endonuclease subunit S [Betaproteobacteria bacterium]|nr:restriction endonuclease subunit S [Betaproteobacteria bacterium]